MRRMWDTFTAQEAVMAYIHELTDWPNFTWNLEALAAPLAEVRHKQGLHLGRMQALGFDLRAEATLTALTAEVVESSAIEGESLPADEVRSSIARQLGLDTAGLPKPGRHVDGVVEMMLDATQRFADPLTAERLCDWHAALFPTGRSGMVRIRVGALRRDEAGPMQVVSGPIGRERVHFQAPAAQRLDGELERFLTWFEQADDIDSILKAGVAHLWFVTLHPFDDGNGRLARAVAEMALARADGSADRFYSMSAGIEAERRAYYLQLEAAQRGSLDITSWLAWFLECLGRALDESQAMLGSVLRRARVWQRLHDERFNDRQRTVVNRMLAHDWQGHLNTSKYAKLAKCSNDTALRDIRELLALGLLAKNPGGGRSTSYRIVEF